MSGTPKEWGAIVSGPQPIYRLERFSGYSSARVVGKKVVDGKPCVVYEVTEGVVGGRSFLYSVWRGYTLEMAKPEGVTLLRITSLKFPKKLKASLFELPPGTTVKVPRDLRVRLLQNVTRIEYPGNGFAQDNATQVLR